MSIPHFNPSINDISEVQITGSEAVFKDEKAPIQSAIEHFLRLYKEQKEHMNPEQLMNFKARFNALFSSYFTHEQEEIIYNILKPATPAPLAIKPVVPRREVFAEAYVEEPERLARNAEEVFKDAPGFIRVTDEAALTLQSQLDPHHYFIGMDSLDEACFLIFTPQKVHFGKCRQAKFEIDRIILPTFEKFKEGFFPDLAPLTIDKIEHPDWEKLPFFYNQKEEDYMTGEQVVPFKMPPWHYCLCKSAIPGCLSLVISGSTGKQRLPITIVPTGGKFLSNGQLYDRIDDIVQSTAKVDGHKLEPFLFVPKTQAETA